MMEVRNSEIFLYKKEPILLFRLSVILITIVLLIFISLFYLKYKDFYRSKGIIVYDKNYYFKITVLLDDLNIILDNKYLYINNTKYKYTISSVNNEILVDNKMNSFKEVFISIDLPDKLLISNNVLNFKIEECSKKLINYLQKYL